MEASIIRQHVVNTLESLREITLENEDTSDITLVLMTALTSLKTGKSAPFPTIPRTIDFQKDDDFPEPDEDDYENDEETPTRVILPQGFESVDEVATFLEGQGLDGELAEEMLSVNVECETGEVADGELIPDIVGNIIDENGRTVKSVGSPEASIQTANEQVGDSDNGDDTAIFFYYERMDGEALLESDVDRILAADASKPLREVMGDYRVVSNQQGDDVSKRNVLLSFIHTAGHLSPTALLTNLVAYRGVAAIPGIGAVSVHAGLPEWNDDYQDDDRY